MKTSAADILVVKGSVPRLYNIAVFRYYIFLSYFYPKCTVGLIRMVIF